MLIGGQAVVDSLHRQPLSGEVFAFANRGRDKVKLLWYDRHGFWLAYKRLERGRFRWPTVGGAIGVTELTLLLEGIDRPWRRNDSSAIADGADFLLHELAVPIGQHAEHEPERPEPRERTGPVRAGH